MLRIYELLLACCPRGFRSVYGAGLRETFAVRLHEAGLRGGRVRVTLFALREFGGLLRAALCERLGLAHAKACWALDREPGVYLPAPDPETFDRERIWTMLQDVRFALRQLARSRSFTVVALGTLALGIGVNTVIFSLVNAVLFQPLPGVREPSRLVAVYTSDYSSGRYGTSSYLDYLDLRDRSGAFSGLAALSESVPLYVEGAGEAERLVGAAVTGDIFAVLGVKASLGRALLPEDDRPGAGLPAVVLSDGMWRRRFGADRNVLGRGIVLDGHEFTIVGVAAPSFSGTSLMARPELYLPLSMLARLQPRRAAAFEHRGHRWLRMIGRLSDGLTLEAAQSRVEALAARLAEAYPDTNLGTLDAPGLPRPVALVPASDARIHPSARQDAVRVAALLLAAVGLALLIACANVANLLLVRSRRRGRELATRQALGAGRGRLVQQLMVESLMLALLGGLAGLGLAYWLGLGLVKLDFLRAFSRWIRIEELPLDGRVLGFTGLVTLLTAVLCGLVPALLATRGALLPALQDGAPLSGGPGERWSLRGMLVAAEVALSLVLLVGTGLLVRNLQQALALDPGFELEDALLVGVDVSGEGYEEARGQAFFAGLRERLEALEGVEAAGLADIVPVHPAGSRTSMVVEGYTPQPGEDMELNRNVVDEGYFRAMGIPLLLGRGFDQSDSASARPVAIVNETFVRRYWPRSSPLGRSIEIGDRRTEVVGVARDSKYRSLREEPMPYVYLPLSQNWTSQMELVVRTGRDPIELAAAVRMQVRDLEPRARVIGIQRHRARMAELVARERIVASLVGALGGLALLLAAVGVYGVMSFVVEARTREIGIRMALGARTGDAVGLVLRQGLRLALVGIGAGLALALGLSSLLASFLYGVSATDPFTYVGMGLVLLGATALACLVPARRAARIDPVSALRCG
jgi:predicted permease